MTKDYYDYFHKLKEHDPRLPQPVYRPEVDPKRSSALELEKKLESLTLEGPKQDTVINPMTF